MRQSSGIRDSISSGIKKHEPRISHMPPKKMGPARSPLRPARMKNIVTEDYPVAKDKLKQDVSVAIS